MLPLNTNRLYEAAFLDASTIAVETGPSVEWVPSGRSAQKMVATSNIPALYISAFQTAHHCRYFWEGSAPQSPAAHPDIGDAAPKYDNKCIFYYKIATAKSPLYPAQKYGYSPQHLTRKLKLSLSRNTVFCFQHLLNRPLLPATHIKQSQLSCAQNTRHLVAFGATHLSCLKKHNTL